MPTLPAAMIPVVMAVAPLVSRRVWGHAQLRLAGAILAPAQRPVAAAPRATGVAHVARFHRDHRVRGRGRWSSLAAGRVPLGRLVAASAPAGPPVCGVDGTPERRRGTRIAATGLDRGAVRSSRSHVVKAGGRRWVLIRDPHDAFGPRALLGPDPGVAPAPIVAWFVVRWRLAVTSQEARRRLGGETQRRWSDLAVRRTTPARRGRFAPVALGAHRGARPARRPCARPPGLPTPAPPSPRRSP